MRPQEDLVQKYSEFGRRGEAFKNSFSERYGGGAFVGTSKVAETFKDDAGDMVNKVVETDTKSINNLIESALNEKVKDEVKKETPTYAKPNEQVVETEMSPDQLNEFINNAIKNEESAKKVNTTKLTDDSGMKNVAAALQTTQDSTLTGLEYYGLDPGIIASLKAFQAQSNNVEVKKDTQPTIQVTNLTENAPALEKNQSIENIQPTTSLDEYAYAFEKQPTEIIERPMVEPVQEETQKEITPTPPDVSDKFSNLIGTVFGADQETPESYKLSSVKATYTKVEKEGGKKEEEDSLAGQELESIDVIGSVVDETGDSLAGQELDTIDVIGSEEDDSLAGQELDTIDVIGSEDENLRPAEEEEDNYSFGDNPWERFKELYLDFYTGGRGAEALKDFNKKTMSGEFPGLESTATSPNLFTEYKNVSPTTKNANDIVRMNNERTQIDSIKTTMQDNVEKKPTQPTIINNNRTVVAKAPEDSKTKRVFSDDNTFNRLSIADSNHPQYYGRI